MIWYKKKCPVCEQKYPKSTEFHELRLQTADGLHTLEICETCSDFLDQSAEVLNRGKR